MRALLLAVLFSFVGIYLVAGSSKHLETLKNAAPKTSLDQVSATKDSLITRADDLHWLIGRWRCVTRQYFAKRDHLLAGRGEDSLEYFNVYLPCADDKLTLELSDNPDRRPIAAEFLVRYIDETGPFEESLVPMAPGGLVRIGRDRIWYGTPPANDFEFMYFVEKRGHRLWLILESKSMRLELMKLEAEIGDLSKSSVKAAIRNYSADQIAELAKRYEVLKAQKHESGETGVKNNKGGVAN